MSSRVAWKCKFGHPSWVAQIRTRTGGGRHGCPYCSGTRVLSENKFEFTHPDLFKQLHPTLNKDVDFDVLSYGSSKKLWWVCNNAHPPWQTTINNRVKRGSGCPYCSGLRATKENCLAATDRWLLAEWDYALNAVSPYEVKAKSNIKAHWICKRDKTHRWQATIKNRVVAKSGCRHCRPMFHSKIEIMIACELASFIDFDVELHEVRIGKKLYNVDMILLDRKIIIEFDGSYWHANSKNKDIKKTKALEAAGWTVIRLREAPLDLLTSNDLVTQHKENITDIVARVLFHLKLVNEDVIKKYQQEQKLRSKEYSDKIIEKYIAVNIARE